MVSKQIVLFLSWDLSIIFGLRLMDLWVVFGFLGRMNFWWMSYLFIFKLSILKWDWPRVRFDSFVLLFMPVLRVQLEGSFGYF